MSSHYSMTHKTGSLEKSLALQVCPRCLMHELQQNNTFVWCITYKKSCPGFLWRGVDVLWIASCLRLPPLQLQLRGLLVSLEIKHALSRERPLQTDFTLQQVAFLIALFKSDWGVWDSGAIILDSFEPRVVRWQQITQAEPTTWVIQGLNMCTVVTDGHVFYSRYDPPT